MLAEAIESPEAFSAWTSTMGQSTASSYGVTNSEALRAQIRERHGPFLGKLLDWYETDRHIFVHASVDYDLDMDEQAEHTLFWQKVTETPPEHKSGKTVVFGHTAQRQGLPRHFGTAICIDTVAKRGGWLTALDVDLLWCWQSDPIGNLRQFALAGD